MVQYHIIKELQETVANYNSLKAKVWKIAEKCSYDFRAGYNQSITFSVDEKNINVSDDYQNGSNGEHKWEYITFPIDWIYFSDDKLYEAIKERKDWGIMK